MTYIELTNGAKFTTDAPVDQIANNLEFLGFVMVTDIEHDARYIITTECLVLAREVKKE